MFYCAYVSGVVELGLRFVDGKGAQDGEDSDAEMKNYKTENCFIEDSNFPSSKFSVPPPPKLRHSDAAVLMNQYK